MVRARNLITNNLSNAYAVGAVSLRGEMYVESAIPTYRIVYHTYTSYTVSSEIHDKISKSDNNPRVVDTITGQAYAYSASYM